MERQANILISKRNKQSKTKAMATTKGNSLFITMRRFDEIYFHNEKHPLDSDNSCHFHPFNERKIRPTTFLCIRGDKRFHLFWYDTEDDVTKRTHIRHSGYFSGMYHTRGQTEELIVPFSEDFNIYMTVKTEESIKEASEDYGKIKK